MNAPLRPRPAALFLLFLAAAAAADPLVIAHRGASGVLPEHSLEAKILAFAQGADYLEQDVVLSRDGVPVVLHDLTLEAVTDVAERFPGRSREDGRYYVIDFDAEELARLEVGPRRRPETGERAFPGRFAGPTGPFRISTLDEELGAIAELRRLLGREVGVHVELKAPAWHRREGADLGRAVLAVLDRHGYRDADDPVFVQCFDLGELRRLRQEFRSPLRLVQLVGENDWGESPTDFEALRTEAGVARLADLVDAVGAWLPQLLDEDGGPSAFRRRLADAGLPVHVYTLRADALPDGVESFQALLRLVVDELQVAGLFTDHPGRAVDFLRSRAAPR